MKKFKKSKNSWLYWLAGFVLTATLFIQTACEKTEDTAEPVITNVRYVNPDKPDSTKIAAIEEWIAIQGMYLKTTTNIYINNLEVHFNPTYVTDNNIVLQIPEETPTMATKPDLVINEIRVVTRHGIATFEFEVIPPPEPPILDSISNEFAKPGEEIILYGRYFYSVEEIIFPDAISATEYTVLDGNRIRVTVPEGIAEDGGIITVNTEYGDGTPGRRARFNDPTGIFIDFNPAPEFWWGITERPDAYIKNEDTYPDIPNSRGNYLHYVLENVAPDTWWIQTSAVPMQPDVLEYDDNIPDDMLLENLELIFELYVNGQWNSGAIEFAFNRDVHEWYFMWKPQAWVQNGEPTPYIADGWRTFGILFRDIAGAVEKTYGDIKNSEFFFNFKNPGPPENSHIDKIDMAFDNFRIVQTFPSGE